MIFIAHRGNINGPIKELENDPYYITDALNRGFHVEVDVRVQNGIFALGHDEPQYIIDRSFLKDDRIWCHAKNVEAIDELINLGVHWFWHDSDDCTLTSRGWVWTHPKAKLSTLMSIRVDPNVRDRDALEKHAAGVCSDYVADLRNS
jgi:hypothetical protein